MPLIAPQGRFVRARALAHLALAALSLAAPACATVKGAPAEARVLETSHMAEALAGVDARTLVVLDIDNTLIEPTSALGSDQWFYHVLAERERALGDDGRALAETMALWNAVQPSLTMRAVEAETPKLLDALREEGVSILALTARTPEVSATTLRQLASVGIELGGATAWRTPGPLPGFEDAKLEGGVLFVGERHVKGDALVALLAEADVRPARVVFVDDKQRHAESVARALGAAGIPVTSYRYGAADAHVASFRPEDADRELAAWRAATR